MKAYVINLDRDRERWSHMEAQGANLGIQWVRVAAVDKRSPEIAERAAHALPGRLGFIISAGAIACLESHRKAWRMIADGGDPYAAVFEDDVVCSSALSDFLANDDWIPADCDVVKLETVLQRATVSARASSRHCRRNIVRLHGRHLGSGAYVIARKTAARLLPVTEGFLDPVDEVLFNVQSTLFPSLTLYQVDPAPCIQGSVLGLDKTEAHLKSDNEANVKEPRKQAYRNNPRRKAARLWEKVLLVAGLRERRIIQFL